MDDFILFPAIDLRQGQVVRLQKGDPDRQTTYSADPAGTARRWLEAGAGWLHVVNLDGAFSQSAAANQAALQQILNEAEKCGGQVQLGGGLRAMQSVEQAFSLGVRRVVLGTLLVEQAHLLPEMLKRWGAERIVASLDAQDGLVRVRGWQQSANLNALQLACELKAVGLEWLVFTDIDRDGMNKGLNLEATINLARRTGLKVVASGGVNSLEEVRAARQAGLAGVIVGRALYDGTLDPVDLFPRLGGKD
jgi:phosphoribosylformimino-5-aminoimidazole carboxamide ribotide isomerase